MQRGGVLIPSGYYSDEIKIIAKTLKDQTSATATAGDIWSGKTAWVNGSKITGTKTQSGNLIYKKFSAVSSSIHESYDRTLYRVEVNNIGMNPVFFYCRRYDAHQGSFVIDDNLIVMHGTSTSSSVDVYNSSPVVMNQSKISTVVTYANTTYYLYVFGTPV